MKNAVFYFSGTGNNLHAAKVIAGQLQDCEVLPVRALERGARTAGYEKIVFCVPSYHSHIPNYVAGLLGKISFESSQKIYSVIVCGGNRGLAAEDLRECISRNGGTVKGEYMVVLPGSYILSYAGFPGFLVSLECFFADRKLRRIGHAVHNGRTSMLRHHGFFYSPKREPELQAAIAGYKDMGLAFTVSDSCAGCGTCAGICPAGNISMEKGKPVFKDGCQQCMACIQWCPRKAIDYNGLAAARRHYHHPAVTLSEMREGVSVFKNE